MIDPVFLNLATATERFSDKFIKHSFYTLKMARVYVTLKIMPEGADADLDEISTKAQEEIVGYGGNVMESKQEPVAFGVKSVNITFSVDEEKGTTDPLEERISKIKGVMSVNVTDVRRAIG